MNHGGLKRARSGKRRIQPKKAYSSSGLLYSEQTRPLSGESIASQFLRNVCDPITPHGDCVGQRRLADAAAHAGQDVKGQWAGGGLGKQRVAHGFGRAG